MEYVITIAITALLTGCLIMWRVGKLLARSPSDVFPDLFRFDLDRLPLNSRFVNWRYERLMRKKGGLPGPAGYIQTREHIVVLTPDDDYRYIQHFGIHKFGQQLLEYLARHARTTASWKAFGDDEMPTISFVRDGSRKRLRPDVDQPGAGGQKTDFLAPEAEPGRRQVKTRFLEPATSAATAAYTPEPAGASLIYDGATTQLPPGGGEAFVGRGEGCEVVVSHDHFSRRHLAVWSAGGQWHVRVLSHHNETLLNGKLLRSETVLADGDRITVGSSAPLIFQYP